MPHSPVGLMCPVASRWEWAWGRGDYGDVRLQMATNKEQTRVTSNKNRTLLAAGGMGCVGVVLRLEGVSNSGYGVRK